MNGDYSWVLSLLFNVRGLAFIVLILGGSIFVHELGHFLAARWRGLKVDRFSIGFGPKIVGWKGRDGVEYKISWLLFGGYVALPQLADVRAVEGEPDVEPRDLPPVSYLDKVIVVTAGVVFNLILALVLALLLWPFGVPVPADSNTQVVGYVYKTMGELREDTPRRDLPSATSPDAPKFDETPAPAYAAGLRPGDRILAIDDEPVHTFRDLPTSIALSSGRDAQNRPSITVTYERDGATNTVEVLPALVSADGHAGDETRAIGLLPAQALKVGDIEPKSPALLGGLRADDVITTVNGQKVYSVDQMNDLIDAANGAALKVGVLRGGQPKELTIQPVPVPRTTPLATITVGGAGAGEKPDRLDLLPVYPKDSTDDPALPTSPVLNLLALNVDSHDQVFGALKSGDYLLKVNGRAVSSIQQTVDAVKNTPAGQPVTLTYLSQDSQAETTLTLARGTPVSATVTPPETIARIGAMFNIETTIEHTPPLQQFADAFHQIFGMLRALFNPHSNIGVRDLSGPLGIGRIIYQFSADVRLALWFALIINVNLAVLNLLPIPVLDGGHLLFFTIARLRGKELPLNFISSAQGLFLIILVSLILYVSFNDVQRMRGDSQPDGELLKDQYYYLHGEMKFPAPPPVPPAPVIPVTTTN
jgi:membrane-associated protease RseP (regulator of RpoE activity)